MTRSPPAVAREALRLALEGLPAYSSSCSRKDFTQHQPFAVLDLKTFLKANYRGAVQALADAAFDSEQSHRYCREDLGESPRRLIHARPRRGGRVHGRTPAPRGGESNREGLPERAVADGPNRPR
jgi:hypothetical protein